MYYENTIALVAKLNQGKTTNELLIGSTRVYGGGDIESFDFTAFDKAYIGRTIDNMATVLNFRPKMEEIPSLLDKTKTFYKISVSKAEMKKLCDKTGIDFVVIEDEHTPKINNNYSDKAYNNISPILRR